jgi:hypothetical protein
MVRGICAASLSNAPIPIRVAGGGHRLGEVGQRLRLQVWVGDGAGDRLGPMRAAAATRPASASPVAVSLTAWCGSTVPCRAASGVIGRRYTASVRDRVAALCVPGSPAAGP